MYAAFCSLCGNVCLIQRRPNPEALIHLVVCENCVVQHDIRMDDD